MAILQVVRGRDRELGGSVTRRSSLITTNLPFSDWGQVFGDDRMTAALLDRLAENAHVLTTTGPSHRTRGRLPTA